MKNIINVVIKIMIVFIFIQFLYQPICHAGFLDNILHKGNEFVETGKNEIKDNNAVIDNDELKSNIDNIYSMLFIIGIICIVLVGAVLGIKFIVGSVEEQAKIKETLIPYFAGSIVIIGAFGIWKVVIILLSELTKL